MVRFVYHGVNQTHPTSISFQNRTFSLMFLFYFCILKFLSKLRMSARLTSIKNPSNPLKK
jgi:hypothetical protein